jgi:hypothetical protein
VIWRANDEAGQRGIDLNYLSPVLFYRPVEFAGGSPDNMLVGANIKLIIWKDAALYGQFVFNEFKIDELKSNKKWWANKYGFQIGLKSYNFLGIKNLDIQTEYNKVRPFTYTWYQSINNYGHANQELAHSLGASFKENVSILRYRYKRLYIELKNMIAMRGEDKNKIEVFNSGNKQFAVIEDDKIKYYEWVVSYGGDIFKPSGNRYGSHGHEIGQGIRTDILNFSGELSWLINPKTDMNIAIGGLYRTQTKGSYEIIDKYSGNIPIEKATINNYVFFITLRTSLRNLYYDF